MQNCPNLQKSIDHAAAWLVIFLCPSTTAKVYLVQVGCLDQNFISLLAYSSHDLNNSDGLLNAGNARVKKSDFDIGSVGFDFFGGQE